MNEEINLDDLSVQELEDLSIALGNQIQHIKNKRIEVNQKLEARRVQEAAQAHVRQLSETERAALIEELNQPQPINIELKPGEMGARGTKGA